MTYKMIDAYELPETPGHFVLREPKWYGSFWFRGKTIRAHTFAHDYLDGNTVPKGHHRDHTCRFSMCVNPAHLEAVPHEENQRRKCQ